MACVAALAIASAALTQTQASADSSAISIGSAGNASDNNGKIELYGLDSSSPISKITASVVDQSTGTNLATVSNFKLVSGTTTAGNWETSSRVQLGALGYYRLDLVITDTAGDTYSTVGIGSGFFWYAVRTYFHGVAVSNRTTDYQNRQVTMTGQLLGQWPASGAITALANVPVYIETPTDEDTSPVTDANGYFSGTEPIDRAGSLQALEQFQTNLMASSSPSFSIKIIPAAAKMVLNLSSTRIAYGGTVTGSATLLWDSPTAGWQPMAGVQVGAGGCNLPVGNGLQQTSDANGNITIPSFGPLTATCTIGAGHQSYDPYVSSASAQATVTVIQPAEFSDFSVTRPDSGDVTVSGHLQFPSLFSPGSPTADIQFSPTGKGGWTTEATALPADWDGTGYAFSATLPSTTAGFWRATFASPGFTNATSSVVYQSAT